MADSMRSILNSIKSMLVPIRREGWPFHCRPCLPRAVLRLVLVADRLDRADPRRLVHLFLPRSAARHAGRSRPRRQPGRRPRRGGRDRRRPARARPRRADPPPRLGLHERLRLPREPRAACRQDRPHRLYAGKIPQRRARQGERGQRAERHRSRQPARPGRRRPDRRARRPAHRLLPPAGRRALRRRADRPHPLRLAASTSICRSPPMCSSPRARPRSPARR